MNRLIHIGGSILSFFCVSLPTRVNLFNAFRLWIFVTIHWRKLYLRTESEYSISSSFAPYLFGAKEVLADKITQIKKNVDRDSCMLVDATIDRYLYIYSHSLIDKQKLSQKEKNEQKEINFRKIEKKYPGLRDYEVSTFYYHNGLTLIPKSILQSINNRDCIDAGAYIGDSSIIYGRLYDFRAIYAFEPLADNFLQLERNVEKFKLETVVPVNKGLGAKNETLSIQHAGSASFISDSNSHQKVDVISIDDFAQSNNLDVGLIKMDIEGFERPALQGAINTIKRNRPILLISIYHSGGDFFEIKPFLEEICPDYVFKIAKLNPFHLTFETMLIAWPQRSENETV